jgi:Lrp/AsnC family transcriptional regulator, leucine-responsive regulatory protein
MDTLDLRILTSLDADARRSYADLARELEVSQPTIADRVRRLETRGILRGTMICLDHARLGYGVGAFVRIRCSCTSKRALVEAAHKMPQIIEMVSVTGEDCCIARVVARSVEELANVLERLSTFGQTSTSIVLGTLVPPRNPISVQQLESTDGTPAKAAVRREAARRGRVAQRARPIGAKKEATSDSA